MREPPLAVDRDGRGFAADGDALRRPICVADGEARPGIHIQFGIHSKGTRGGMRDCHLRQRTHKEQGDRRADQVADDDARAGDAHRQRAAEEKSGADRAPDGDHTDLAGDELARQLFALLDAAGSRVSHL